MANTEGVGYEVICAIRKATTWGTAVVTGSGYGFRATKFTWFDKRDPLPDSSLNGHVMNRETTDTGNRSVGGSIEFDLKYEGHHLFLASILGTAAVAGSNPYTHTWSMLSDLTGIFHTICMFDKVGTHEFVSCKITKVRISGKAGGRIQVSVDFVADQRNLTGSQTAGLTATTEPSTINYVMFQQSIVTYQTITQNGTLAALEINAWDVEIDRGMESGDSLYTSSYAPLIREPKAGLCVPKVKITMPYKVSTYLTAALAGTTYELKFAHNAGSDKKFELYLPSVTWEESDQSPGDKGTIPQTLSGRCDKAVTAPTDFNSLTVPHIIMVNTVSAAALA